jgi:hypothetical protein
MFSHIIKITDTVTGAMDMIFSVMSLSGRFLYLVQRPKVM